MKKNLLAVAISSLALATMAQAAFKDMNVDGIQISKQEQEMVYNSAVQQGAQGGEALEKAVRERFIGEAAVLAAARKSDVGNLPAVKQAIEVQTAKVKDTILVQALIEQVASKYQPTTAELEALYNKIKEGTPKTEYKYSVIATRTEAQAKQALDRLNKKEAFGKVAVAMSEDPTAAQNGELQWMFDQSLQPQLQEAVKTLKKGQYLTTPVKVEGQYVILKLDDTRPTQFKTFEQYKPQLEQLAREQKVQEYLVDLAKKATVK